jgi:hypothetical protein
MVNDAAALAEILAPTWLRGREITTIALKNGEVIFSVALGDVDQARLAWEAGRSVVRETGRWPAISPGHGEPALTLSERRHRRVSDPRGPDEHIVREARDAIAEIRRARDAVWPERPWRETLDFHLDTTRNLIGTAGRVDSTHCWSPARVACGVAQIIDALGGPGREPHQLGGDPHGGKQRRDA